MEVTGGGQNKNIALETGIKRKEMGCFLFRSKGFLVLFGFGLVFFNRFYISEWKAEDDWKHQVRRKIKSSMVED